MNRLVILGQSINTLVNTGMQRMTAQVIPE